MSKNELTVKSRPRNPIEMVIDMMTYILYQSRFVIGRTAVLVSDYMSGKMEGFPSISTSCNLNPFCLARILQGIGICKYCFAVTTMSFKDNLRHNCELNFRILTKKILPLHLLPHFCKDVRQVRLESFGDVYNVTQAINYINIAKVNPHCRITVWSKNPNIWAQAFAIAGKPFNMTFVLSSQELNTPAEVKPGWWFVNIVFTVYDPQYVAAHNIRINCGARHCLTCRKCYPELGEEQSQVIYINELLKKNGGKRK